MPLPTVEELVKARSFQTLTPEQVESFMKRGFLRLPGAIPLDKCDWWAKDVWHRLGMDPNDKSTWTVERSHMPRQNLIPAKDIAPVAWAAICELLGGEERIAQGGEMWTDAFIVNHGTDDVEGKTFGPRELDNWHVDGDFFIHFLDSPEQSLLVIPCWSDVETNAGATWICDEGPKRVAQHMFNHPEGLSPMMTHRDDKLKKFQHDFYHNIIREASEDSFHEMTGNKGDVILMHPLMLHSASKNSKRAIRIITNPPVSLSEPFQFNRSNPEEYSLVELKTIQDVGGLEKFKDWKITGEREMFLPARVEQQTKKQALEIERMKKLGLETLKTGGLISQTPNLFEKSQKVAA
ncbi:hypothetical protein B0I35DRAFT_407040 [Stachybotrys elegans]|uniref:Uncharacterized protein n=1 Tax=Stachybotrys elegans TaxID=80388 RepID=A0A8K0T0N1_9HYPO|nr:hypothetical protein B0I35DRAFT_407040 [Stachybotrys elegans]